LAQADRRVWFITGCSSGFGRALVHAARSAGDPVVATRRRVEALGSLAAEGVMTLALDVTRLDTFEQALDTATARFGRVDVLVNNAGTLFLGALEETSLADLRQVMETMFFGPAALTRAIIPRMRRQGFGAIVQISSQGGQITALGFSAYYAAKFAPEGLSEAVAAEVVPFGIRLLIVEPGSFRPELLGRSLSAAAVMEEYAGPLVRRVRTFNAKTAAKRGSSVSRRCDPRGAQLRRSAAAPRAGSRRRRRDSRETRPAQRRAHPLGSRVAQDVLRRCTYGVATTSRSHPGCR
jgi:NAD(P)-dependent dehydrogenase (short-subunit alcohol dehydrogenase family)